MRPHLNGKRLKDHSSDWPSFKSKTLFSKITRAKRLRGMAETVTEAVEHLPSNQEALSSNLSIAPPPKKGNRFEIVINSFLYALV
jgi:hypothetical protein